MGKKHKRVNHIIDDVACEVAGTKVSKKAAKRLGISRKEANAIMFGIANGMTMAATLHEEPSIVTEESAFEFSDMAVIDILSDYAEFKDSVSFDRVLDDGGEA